MAMVIRAEHVNPFISSAMETFKKMINVDAKPGKLITKSQLKEDYDISGIIGISGKIIGTIAVSFPKVSALTICNQFMSASHNELSDEILDAVGELVNIIAGNAKKGLSEFDVAISLPSVVLGLNHRIIEPKDAVSFVVPFATPLGGFYLGVSLKPA